MIVTLNILVNLLLHISSRMAPRSCPRSRGSIFESSPAAACVFFIGWAAGLISAGTGAGGGLARPFTSGLGGGLSGGASLGAASRLARGCLLAGFGGGPFELPKS